MTRSQARLTAEKLPEMKDAPGFREAFLVDGKAPEVGAKLKQTAFAATLEHLANAGLDDFYRGDVGREIAADLERIGSPVTRADLEQFARRDRRAAQRADRAPARSTTRRRRRRGWPRSSSSRCSTGCASAEAESFEHIHGLVEATKRAFRVRDRVVTDPDRITERSRAFPVAGLPRRRGRQDRPQQGGALAGAVRRGRHHLDGRGRCLRPRRLLHPVALLGVRLRLRAAEDRRADAEPRRQLLARSEGAQRAGARPPAVPHAQSGARRAARTAASWPTARWAATASRRSQAAVFTRHVTFGQPLDKALDAPRWLLGRTWGSTHTNLAHGVPLRRQSDRPADVGRP